jgi:hypothetical protein
LDCRQVGVLCQRRRGTNELEKRPDPHLRVRKVHVERRDGTIGIDVLLDRAGTRRRLQWVVDGRLDFDPRDALDLQETRERHESDDAHSHGHTFVRGMRETNVGHAKRVEHLGRDVAIVEGLCESELLLLSLETSLAERHLLSLNPRLLGLLDLLCECGRRPAVDCNCRRVDEVAEGRAKGEWSASERRSSMSDRTRGDAPPEERSPLLGRPGGERVVLLWDLPRLLELLASVIAVQEV